MAPQCSDTPPFPASAISRNHPPPAFARNGLDHHGSIGLSVSNARQAHGLCYVGGKAPCALPSSSAVTHDDQSPAEILSSEPLQALRP